MGQGRPPEGSAAPTPPANRPRRSYWRWHVAGAALLLVGLVSSAVGAMWWGGQVRKEERSTFNAKVDGLAAEVASTIRRDVDATDGASKLLQVEPDTTTEDFQHWFTLMDSSGRYSGLLLFGEVQVVAKADAPAVLAKLKSSTVGAVTAITPEQLAEITKTYDMTLDPAKASYCIPTASAGMSPASALITQMSPPYRKLDQCDTPAGPYFELARDTGQVVVAPYGVPNVVRIMAPLYKDKTTPTSLADRRAAFTGTMTSQVDMRALLGDAVGSDTHLRLELARVQPSGAVDLLATSGDQATEARSTALVNFDADGAWQLKVATNAAVIGIPARTQSMVVFGIGALLTLILYSLIHVLTRGRDRALRLVSERTGELRHLALHDPLTSLPNRTLINDRAEHLLARCQRNHERCAALFIDLDGFKDINDTLGHEAGDLLLQAVAGRLRRVLRQSDTVGRLGGDEFVVLLDGDALAPGPEVVADKILEVLREPFRVTSADVTFPITASIGIAVAYDGTASTLLRDADVALYQAKAAGRDCYVIFRPEMQQAAVDRLALGAELRSAIEAQQFYLEYQPTFDVETQQLQGVEALVRWDHPVRGTIPPLDFIPLAEETGLIIELGTWIMREACNQMAQWHSRGYDLRLSVNVASRQLDRADFVQTVAAALNESGLSAERLVLEITESTLMRDADAVAGRLHELKSLGVRIAIDDFGTGYSSLSYLRQFPVDSIKIDRSFLSDLGYSAEAQALVRSLIQLGKNLGLETLAEGIEEHSQMDYLRAEQCDTGQGFLYARPLSVADAEELFAGAGAYVTPTSA
ncbi:MAG: sensor diguanylate cyclase [Acidimicrobiia bacterium]|nr:sensor diguanylate cyclase [Acidimicrobiia bacterium]